MNLDSMNTILPVKVMEMFKCVCYNWTFQFLNFIQKFTLSWFHSHTKVLNAICCDKSIATQ